MPYLNCGCSFDFDWACPDSRHSENYFPCCHSFEYCQSHWRLWRCQRVCQLDFYIFAGCMWTLSRTQASQVISQLIRPLDLAASWIDWLFHAMYSQVQHAESRCTPRAHRSLLAPCQSSESIPLSASLQSPSAPPWTPTSTSLLPLGSSRGHHRSSCWT